MKKNPLISHYEALGTHWSISIWDSIHQTRFDTHMHHIREITELFESTYSRFRPTSLLRTLQNKTGVVEVPCEFVSMLRLYSQLYKDTEGKFTPLLGQTLRELGYDESYSLQKNEELSNVPEFDSAVLLIDDTHIDIRERVSFDLGALGKGFLVDLIYAYLRQEGLQRFLVNGSGDIAYEGDGEPLVVGLEHPLDTTKVIGKVEILSGFMCSSANNRRRWGKYAHTIDPHSLESPDEIIATWVMAESTAIADGLATCFFFVAPEDIRSVQILNYLLLNNEMRVKISPGFDVTLF